MTTLLLVAVLAVPVPVSADGGQVASCPGNERAQLRRVIDGDTVAVTWRGRKDKIRLLRVQTPEVDEHGYREATASLEELLVGAELTFDFEERGIIERDSTSSRRLLAYVCSGPTNVNVEQVRRGWSRAWFKYGRGRNAEALARAEAEARTAGRGLWRWLSNVAR